MTDLQYKDILDRLDRIEALLSHGLDPHDPGPPLLSVVAYEPIKGEGVVWENKIDLPEGKGFANQGRVSGSVEKNCLLGVYDGLVMLQKIPGIGKLDVEVSSPDVWSWLSGESNPPEELQEQVSHILGLLAVYDYEVMQEL